MLRTARAHGPRKPRQRPRSLHSPKAPRASPTREHQRGTTWPLCITVAGVPQPSPPRRGPPKPALILRRVHPVSAERQARKQGTTPAEAVGYNRLVMLVATPFRRSHEARPSRSHVTRAPDLPRRRRVHTRAQLVARGKQRLSATACPARARANAAAAFPARDDAAAAPTGLGTLAGRSSPR
jgi:hypothetical protein